jgi:hypothetical protein
MQNRITAVSPPVSFADSGHLQIVIPYRSHKLTRAAIHSATRYAEGLDVLLRLIDVHVVPYGFSLESPEVNPKHLSEQMRTLAKESPVPVKAEIVYARDWEEGLFRSLRPRSFVLIPKTRWHLGERRLATRLCKLGHQVLWIE